tara:strand:- start:106021 stop:106173 length:153 start_codon:yes stop_codon:yes gene_type:complete
MNSGPAQTPEWPLPCSRSAVTPHTGRHAEYHGNRSSDLYQNGNCGPPTGR